MDRWPPIRDILTDPGLVSSQTSTSSEPQHATTSIIPKPIDTFPREEMITVKETGFATIFRL